VLPLFVPQIRLKYLKWQRRAQNYALNSPLLLFTAMQHPELPIFAFLAAVLVLIPLSWHWKARNVATLSIIAWLFVVNFIYGVNSIIWAGNVNNPVPVWCDISMSPFFLGQGSLLNDMLL
jgi:hypothetical protein